MNVNYLMFIFILLISSFSLAFTQDDIIWKGYININLEENNFDTNQTIKGHLIVANEEYYPILSQKIVLHVGDGIFYYPSQFAEDNVIYEEVIETDWILPRTVKRIDFELPKLKPGNYHLDVYSWISKSKFNGASSIFLSPTSINFNVSGEKIANVEINRLLTNFGPEKVIGPVGFPIAENEEFLGEIYLDNKSNINKNNLKLLITVCDWSVAFCDDEGLVFDVGSINANESKKIDVKLTAPKIPSAYEINMTLFNTEEIFSIYKNRVIVEGGTSKIRKLYLDGLKEKSYSLKSLIAGSPDHFNYPDFENFEVIMKVFNENNLVQEEKQNVIKIAAGEIQQIDNKITPTIFDYVCLSIEKNNIKYDEECFRVELKDLEEAYDSAFPEELKIDWNYDETNSIINIELYKEIKKSLNLRLRILEQNNTLINEEIISKTNVNKSYNVKKENLTLIIDDFDAKRQRVIELNFKEDKKEAFNVSEGISCPGSICSGATVCSTDPVNSKEGACCLSVCVAASVSEGEVGSEPLIFWISIMLFILAILILASVIIKGRKK